LFGGLSTTIALWLLAQRTFLYLNRFEAFENSERFVGASVLHRGFGSLRCWLLNLNVVLRTQEAGVARFASGLIGSFVVDAGAFLNVRDIRNRVSKLVERRVRVTGVLVVVLRGGICPLRHLR
jgi:hypothetical protein